MDQLNETQCEKLDQILSLFGEEDYMDAERVLKVEPNVRKANALIDVLYRRNFIARVGETEDNLLPLVINLKSAADIFIDNGGFLGEFQRKQQSSYGAIIHNHGDGNIINTGNDNRIGSLPQMKLASDLPTIAEGIPYLEVDLIYHSSGRFNNGYSDKNPIETDEQGNPVYIIGYATNPIIHWRLDWDYALVIHNNSSYPAFNVRMEQVTEQQFTNLSKLPKINHLPALGKLELSASFEDYIESSHVEADMILNYRIPEALHGMHLEVTYFDEKRNPHTTVVQIVGQDIVNTKK